MSPQSGGTHRPTTPRGDRKMTAGDKKPVHPGYADRIVKALPAKLREEAEIKRGAASTQSSRSAAAALPRCGMATSASSTPIDGSADSLKAFARMTADAAPEPREEPKPVADGGGEKRAARLCSP